MMQANVMKIQQLQSRLDELNTNIASRNTHGALENCHQLLQADKDRYHGIRLCTINRDAPIRHWPIIGQSAYNNRPIPINTKNYFALKLFIWLRLLSEDCYLLE